jgi:hypothetical protein
MRDPGLGDRGSPASHVPSVQRTEASRYSTRPAGGSPGRQPPKITSQHKATRLSAACPCGWSRPTQRGHTVGTTPSNLGNEALIPPQPHPAPSLCVGRNLASRAVDWAAGRASGSNVCVPQWGCGGSARTKGRTRIPEPPVCLACSLACSLPRSLE